ncbi:vacuolar protein sorting-associated protein 54-like isoform X2 [Gordionus sp. m RMFG-2023]
MEADMPDYFYKPNFSFLNPVVHKLLIPSSTQRLNDWLGPANASHEKLSRYLDGIESKIALNVSRKSGNFIHALSYVSHLRDTLTDIRYSIQETRHFISVYNSQHAINTAKLLRLQIKLSNYHKIRDKLKIMAILCQSQPTLQILLANNEYVSAFDLVSSSRDVLSKELKGVRSFRYLDAQLLEIENLIFRMLWADYTSIITRHFCDKDKSLNINPSTNPNQIKGFSAKMENKLSSLLTKSLDLNQNYSLTRSKDITQNFQSFEEVLKVGEWENLLVELSSVVLGLLYLRNLSFIEYLKEESCSHIDNIIAGQLKSTIHHCISKPSTNNSSFNQNHSNYEYDNAGHTLIENFPNLTLNALVTFFRNVFCLLTRHISNVKLFAFLISILLFASSSNASNSQHVFWNTIRDKINESFTDWHNLIFHKYSQKDFNRASNKLNNVLRDIDKYLEDESVKLLEKWSLSFNPVFITNLFNDQDEADQIKRPEENLSNHNRGALGEENALLNAFQSFHTLYTISREFFGTTDFNLSRLVSQNPALLSPESEGHHSEENLGVRGKRGIPNRIPLPECENIDVKDRVFIADIPPSNPSLYPDDKNPFDGPEEAEDDVIENESGVALTASSLSINDTSCFNGDISHGSNYDNAIREEDNDSKGVGGKVLNGYLNNGKDIVYRKSALSDEQGQIFLNVLRKLVSQTLNFYAQRAKRDLQSILSAEKWKPFDFPKRFGSIFENFITHSASDLLITDFVQTKSRDKLINNLLIKNESYILCCSTFALLKYVLLYNCLAERFPFASRFIASAIFHLLKLHNSKNYQLLLGAGAIKSAGLKSITIKHLALSLANLRFVIRFVYNMADRWSRDTLFSNHKNLSKNFDVIYKDYSMHVDETVSKIAEIMEHNLSKYISEWEVKAPTPSSVFISIIKQLEIFYSTINTIVPSDSLKIIMIKIDTSLKRLIKYKISSLNIVNDGGPRAGVVISELLYYQNNFRKFGVSADNAQSYDMIWDSLN